ncbi:MAG TPA: ABC transporter substrate-binding protein [Pyrinomonadaceae bacterium]|jgi:peptide/nickel transport system substrate-binding protein
MASRRFGFVALTVLLVAAMLLHGCGRGGQEAKPFVIVLDASPETLDPLRGTDGSSERIRQLMFNTLVRKNDKFEYIGELASNIQNASDGLSVTFTLRNGVTFHDGRPLTSADAKYTLETLLASDSGKAASFFEAGAEGKQSYVSAIEAPDAQTLVVRLRKPWLKLLTNLVPVPIIPQGSAATQKEKPLGSGAFRFVRYDESQQVVDLEAYEQYWDGAPQIKQLRVRAIIDSNTLQAELRSGQVDLAPNYANLTPDSFGVLERDPKLKVQKFPGANIQYLGFNVEAEPLKDVRVRQAISHAINRESIVRDLQLDQARIAHSILPEESWAYASSQKYDYNPEQSKRLLDEAGFRDPDGDGPQMRFPKPIILKVSSASTATRQYSQVIQNSLRQIGVPVEIETLETVSLLAQLRNGQFQITSSRWIGGNQDPVFLEDLFSTAEIPTQERAGRNRSRYSNPEFDRIIKEAVSVPLDQRDRAKPLFAQAQAIISRDIPMLPLWYPAIMVVARKGVGNIAIDPSGDWDFVRKLTLENQ